MEVHSEYVDTTVDSDTISIDTLALEQMVLKERDKEIKELQSLNRKVCFLHSNLLYYRHAKSARGSACYKLWITIVLKVGGSPNGWWDLGTALGIPKDDLEYIMHSVKDDRVDTVLEVFRQNDNATMDKIVDALTKLKRYDILKSIEGPLCEIAQSFHKDDSAYHSESSGQREIVTINLPSRLTAPLNKNLVIEKGDPKKPKRPSLRPPPSANDPILNDRPILFLTYSQDGLPTALNIQEYVENWLDVPNVEVITLNNRREQLYQNPEKFIREYFEKADIIIPIISPGYLEEIKSHTPAVPNTSDNLDHKYVNFIYNLIVNHYIHATGCLNKKVRSVLPQNSDPGLFSSISMYPDLMPWTYETSFDEQFKAFLKK